MLFFSIRFLLALLVALESVSVGRAQVPLSNPADTLHKYEEPRPGTAPPARAWYQKKLVRASAVPLLLIGGGIASLGDHTPVGSYAVRRQLQEHFPNFHTRVDDYLQYVPYLELGATTLFGIESRDDRLNTLLVIAKSELLMTVAVTAVKYSTRVLRPDESAHNSFPSGHTAQAFLAASIVHAELRGKSQWYGVGAYTVAAGVGTLRMLNNKHWESDVLAGAGFGILSAHLAYLSHRNRWGRKPGEFCRQWQMSPTWQPGGGAGLSVSWQPR
ncbi:phosphatase PAP2 family protein [Hymenobacter chitinivorans]|uniref:PAP2 superfamily protein n=1 Tax=Hymenobacter chitinivorans DSM 11115 TaxID=1121954 RepID=A0A2M9ASK5_9BACT|nr:phosphatase PAP2 family protein [Hymenobacter chitinivorans]PJJ48674.1 PAP2 superfamily protein [Hymenobacter chitinivorans DSM 11115]